MAASREEYEVPASGANTEARFGEAVSRSTFPIFVDEIEKLFDTNASNSIYNKNCGIKAGMHE